MRGLVRQFYIWRLHRSRLRQAFHSRIAEQVPKLEDVDWIVDVGCGPGLLEQKLLDRMPGTRLVVLDIDRRMLRAARSKVQVDAIQATVLRLPIKSNSVPLVLSSASLKDWGDRTAGIREVLRTLRPEGSAMLYEFLTVGPGSAPGDFALRYGLISDILRRVMKFGVRFSLQDVEDLRGAIRHMADVDVRLEADLAVVRIRLTGK